MAAAIVCGVDETSSARRAARVASALAERLGSRLVFVHVSARTVVAAPVGAFAPALDPREAHEIEEESRTLVDAVVAEEGLTGAAVRTEVGDAAAGLVAVAGEEDAELLVVGTRGRSEIAAAVLGSVSAAVIRRARCPVLAVPPDVDAVRWNDATGPILCGVHDGESGRRAVRTAASLARRLHAPLRLVHVASPVTLPGLSPVPGAVERVTELETREGHALLAEVAESERLDASVERHVVVGRPAETLLAHTAEAAARLLVVGGGGHVGWASALVGRVSSEVAAHASCPVVVVPSEPNGQDGPRSRPS